MNRSQTSVEETLACDSFFVVHLSTRRFSASLLPGVDPGGSGGASTSATGGNYRLKLLLPIPPFIPCSAVAATADVELPK